MISFFIASAIVTFVTSGLSASDFKNLAQPDLIKPIGSLRGWTFLFCFLSIGLTTRFRELKAAGLLPFLAFTIGVAVNVAAGY